ncbi:MAG: MarR family winged helix-turn-helix transcriptional regulator [Fidelibacterota bacterium]
MVNNKTNKQRIPTLLQTLSKFIIQVNEVSFLKQSTRLPLSTRQFEILKILSNSGPCTVSDLSLFLSISKPATSKSVNNLVKHNLVQRDIPPLDRRKILVKILPGGSKIVRQYNTMVHEQSTRILKMFSEKELNLFENILQKYIRSLLEEYRHETDIICLNCNSRFLEDCPFVAEGQPLCYHAIVEATAEMEAE